MAEKNGKDTGKVGIPVRLFQAIKPALGILTSKKYYKKGDERLDLEIPVPAVGDEDGVKAIFGENLTAGDIWEAGFRQKIYAETFWDSLWGGAAITEKRDGKDVVVDYDLSKIEAAIGNPGDPDFADKVRSKFEDALIVEKRERKTSEVKKESAAFKQAKAELGVETEEEFFEMIRKIKAQKAKKA